MNSPNSGITGLLIPESPIENRSSASYGSRVMGNLNMGNEHKLGQKINVVLVEDHRMVREGTRELLEQCSDIQVVGEAGSGEEALELLARLSFDVMIVDIQLPGISGIDLVRESKKRSSQIKCLILSAFDEYVFAVEALGAGAHGYLLKTVGISELIGAVRAVATGSTVLDDGVSKRLGKYWHQLDRHTREELTRREIDVLKMLALGNSNKEIARDLNLGVRTVESYVSNILSKFAVRSRTEAVIYAINNHLISNGNIDNSR